MDKLQIMLSAINILIPGIILSIWIHKSGKKDNAMSKTMACLIDLFSEYKKTMRNINKALAESKKLYVYLKQGKFSDFNKVYYTKEYETFREVGYFFELLGTMVRRNEIQSESVIHFFSFPIEFFRNTKKIRDIIRKNNCLPDYWNNFCYLCALYNEVKMIYTVRGWTVNGEIVLLSPEELEELPAFDKKHIRFWLKEKAKNRRRNFLDRWRTYSFETER
ncbi:MAG: hypothetical protein LBQ88_15330 [Treponema sp.]|jgi:hypothetical protein|nr:hypothetical protein [Treponema sp.]